MTAAARSDSQPAPIVAMRRADDAGCNDARFTVCTGGRIPRRWTWLELPLSGHCGDHADGGDGSIWAHCAAAETTTRTKRRLAPAARIVDSARSVYLGSVAHGAARALLLAVCIFTALCACGPLPSQSPASSTSDRPCSGDPRAHVYSPDRLQLLASCVTVTGTIEESTPEPDGDYHIRLRLDDGQTCAGESCVNATNRSEQRGDLLLEPVCEHDVTQPDAVPACAGYRNPLALPRVGSHVAVSGPWVTDTVHGWNEIHPLEAIGGA